MVKILYERECREDTVSACLTINATWRVNLRCNRMKEGENNARIERGRLVKESKMLRDFFQLKRTSEYMIKINSLKIMITRELISGKEVIKLHMGMC